MPQSFLEERFPVYVSEGSKGGPGFNTTIFTSQSGFEQRNANWATSRATYDVAFGIRDEDDLADVLEFFYVMHGRATGFRFKDWGDYRIVDGNIGTGDGAEDTYQIVKKYTVNSNTYTRTITKIVANTLIVRVNDVVKTLTTDYTVDMNTGIITFGVGDIPGAAEAVEVDCEFDVPVRFDIDDMPISWEAFQIQSASGITLVEVRIA